MRPIQQTVPLVTCPACAWARGGLSLMGMPMLVDALLRQALAEHLQAVHALSLDDLTPAPAAEAAPEPAPAAESTERRSA